MHAKYARRGRLSQALSRQGFRLQQRLGGVSQLVVVDAQRSYLNAALACVQTEAERLSDTVALYAALAGGWTTTPQ